MKAGLFLATFLLTSTMVSYAGPPVARFQSVLGNFDVLLDPVAAPRSVENFSTYANRGTYDTSFIHRSTTYNPADIQIVQGGGFKLVGSTIEAVPADPPIPLEAGMANARGTTAMADNATSDTSTNYIKIFHAGSGLLRCIRINYWTGIVEIGSNSAPTGNIDQDICTSFDRF
jgi:cyclophilin family peptidyl-prolyl cis-trans isomerase